MISYEHGGFWYILNIFKFRGSVFPQSLLIATPPAAAAFVIKYMIDAGHLALWTNDDSILRETQAWSGFSFLVGFLIVFRTSQAYNRFWDGCTATHTMRAEWFDACSALVSFCQHSKAEKWKILEFKNTLIRLFSMMHAAALAELEEVNVDGDLNLSDVKAFQFNLIDPSSMDEDSLQAVKESNCRVELIFTWIQFLIVDQIDTGVLSIPPPILSRAFQEIANGMVAFHDAMKISYVPFPFPYAQTCDALLILHWLVVPFLTAQWVSNAGWSMTFSFIPVFCLWSLNLIAVEIENPFGTDDNDLDGHYMQEELNRNLLMLLRPSTVRIPTVTITHEHSDDFEEHTKSFLDVWEELGDESVARTKRVALATRADVEQKTKLEHSSTAEHHTLARRTSNIGFEGGHVEHHQSHTGMHGVVKAVTRRWSVMGSAHKSTEDVGAKRHYERSQSQYHRAQSRVSEDPDSAAGIRRPQPEIDGSSTAPLPDVPCPVIPIEPQDSIGNGRGTTSAWTASSKHEKTSVNQR